MLAVVGRAEDNPFVETTRRDMAELRKRALRLRAIAAAKRAT
jgi:hypothetical protein